MPLVGIFDGDCGLCSALVDYVERTSRSPHAVVFQPSHAPDAFTLVDRATGATIASGADAINALLTHTQHPLAALARAVARIPGSMPIERRVYALVSKYRRRISRWLGLRACGIT